MLAWPRYRFTSSRLAPLASMSDAALWPRSWMRMCGRSAVARKEPKRRLRLRGSSGVPRGVVKT
jgi:hypothetical protein